MLVCSVSARPRRILAAIATEAATAADAPGTLGLGKLVQEAATANATVNVVAAYGIAIVETASALDTSSATLPSVVAAAVIEAATATEAADGSLPGNWTPAALGADVWAWWKFDAMSEANGVAVASVVDSSGNGRTLTTSGAPTAKAAAQNGLKSLDFFGSKYATFASASALTSGSFFAVNKGLATTGSINIGGICDMGTDTPPNRYTYAGTVYSDFLSNSLKTAAAVTVNVWHQVMFWSAPNDWGHAMDGADQYTTSSNTVAGATTCYLASDSDFSSWRHYGEFGEVLILSNKPTTPNRQRMEGYLAHKWGITAALPGGHPYKTTPP